MHPASRASRIALLDVAKLNDWTLAFRKRAAG